MLWQLAPATSSATIRWISGAHPPTHPCPHNPIASRSSSRNEQRSNSSRRDDLALSTWRDLEVVRLAYLGLSWLISSHRILFILPAEHYSFYQPNTLLIIDIGPTSWWFPTLQAWHVVVDAIRRQHASRRLRLRVCSVRTRQLNRFTRFCNLVRTRELPWPSRPCLVWREKKFIYNYNTYSGKSSSVSFFFLSSIRFPSALCI
jgi:hypothetical protein